MNSSYRNLLAWQQAMDLVDMVYGAVRDFPRDELFGLTSQMRRSAASVPANIAEGRGRRSYREYRVYLRRARGSLMELETHIEIARRQSLLESDSAQELLAQSLRVVQLINGVIRSVSARIPPGDRRPATGERTHRSSP